MGGSYNVVMGDRGRLVIPAELREQHGFEPGSPLILVETEDGVLLLSRDELKRLVRERLKGPSLVDELLRERRAAAAADNAE